MLSTLLALALLSGPPIGLHLSPGGDPNTVVVAWDASITPGVTGYRLVWGTIQGDYQHVVEVPGGQMLQGTLTFPGPGTYYISVEAENVNVLSDPASPVSFTVAAIPPECTLPLGAQAVSGVITNIRPNNQNLGTDVFIGFKLASLSAVTDIHIVMGGQVWSTSLSGVRSGGIYFTAPLTPGTYNPSVFATNSYGCSSVFAKGPDGQPLSFTIK